MKPGEPTELDYQLETKDGEELRFVYTYDSERENRGFVIDRLQAFIGDDLVGYIKASYVGGDRVGHFYPTVLNYISQIGGSSVLPWDNATLDPRTASPEQLAKITSQLHAYRYIMSLPDEPVTEYKHLEKWMKAQAKYTHKLRDANKNFEEFLSRTVDRPIVDFVNTRLNEHNGVNKDYQGKGIAVFLYQVMATELGKRGMTFRSSSLQSEQAQGVWRKFEAEGWTKMDGDRLALDPEKFDLTKKPSFAGY